MKYLLMMQLPYGEYKTNSIYNWPEADAQAHIDFLQRLNKQLSDAGELVGIEALVPPDEARIVRAKHDGSVTVTDGPFAEAKEFLAGYWIIDVKSRERACEIAGLASAAPGRGGKPLNMPIEVRGVMAAPGPMEGI